MLVHLVNKCEPCCNGNVSLIWRLHADVSVFNCRDLKHNDHDQQENSRQQQDKTNTVWWTQSISPSTSVQSQRAECLFVCLCGNDSHSLTVQRRSLLVPAETSSPASSMTQWVRNRKLITTDRQTDRQRDRQTDRQTETQGHSAHQLRALTHNVSPNSLTHSHTSNAVKCRSNTCHLCRRQHGTHRSAARHQLINKINEVDSVTAALCYRPLPSVLTIVNIHTHTHSTSAPLNLSSCNWLQFLLSNMLQKP